MMKLTLVLAAVAASWTASPAVESYHVNPAKSTLTIEVGKAGAFSFMAGHTHEVAGPVTSGSVDFDRDHPERSRVRLSIATASLKVSGRNEPPADVPKVQERMEGDDVLAVGRFREIRFESTSIARDLTVTGNLTIRDATRPVSVPVHMESSADGLHVTGRFSIKQSAFGIKPVSVGGVVAVKDALDIRFSIVAEP